VSQVDPTRGRRTTLDAAIVRHRLGRRLASALACLPAPPTPPVLVADLQSFDRNLVDVVRRAGGTPVRLATKSVRVPALVRRALAADGVSGVLAYTLSEAVWLAREEGCDDVVMGYPSVDAGALREVASDAALADAVTLMVDDTAQLDLVDRVRPHRRFPVNVALDLDAGLAVAGTVLGPRRSPLRSVTAVRDLARHVAGRPGFRLAGVMTYEGQVAGVPDDVPGERLRSLAGRGIKAASLRQLGRRRRELAEALAGVRDPAGPWFWNAGGTGSLETSAADPTVTEVTAGSGLLGPHLFDHYRGFRPEPAMFFGVPVVRRPARGLVTVAGGGFVASGAPGRDRSPLPWAPPGLELTGLEGAGEVQTPLRGPGADLLQVGDLVWFRHAKAGEAAEHATGVHLVAGSSLVDVVPTYRGLGHAW
jgi:D-serine deaminase-like pyridoxal phosphate-dependent protein